MKNMNNKGWALNVSFVGDVDESVIDLLEKYEFKYSNGLWLLSSEVDNPITKVMLLVQDIKNKKLEFCIKWFNLFKFDHMTDFYEILKEEK